MPVGDLNYVCTNPSEVSTGFRVQPEDGEAVGILVNGSGGSSILEGGECRIWNCIWEVVWPGPIILSLHLFQIGTNPSNIQGEGRTAKAIPNYALLSRTNFFQLAVNWSISIFGCFRHNTDVLLSRGGCGWYRSNFMNCNLCLRYYKEVPFVKLSYCRHTSPLSNKLWFTYARIRITEKSAMVWTSVGWLKMKGTQVAYTRGRNSACG